MAIIGGIERTTDETSTSEEEAAAAAVTLEASEAKEGGEMSVPDR